METAIYRIAIVRLYKKNINSGNNLQNCRSNKLSNNLVILKHSNQIANRDT